MHLFMDHIDAYDKQYDVEVLKMRVNFRSTFLTMTLMTQTHLKMSCQ